MPPKKYDIKEDGKSLEYDGKSYDFIYYTDSKNILRIYISHPFHSHNPNTLYTGSKHPEIKFYEPGVREFKKRIYSFLLMLYQRGFKVEHIKLNVRDEYDGVIAYNHIMSMVKSIKNDVYAGKTPDLEPDVDMTEFKNSIARSSHDFTDLIKYIEKQGRTSYIPEKYMKFLNARKSNTLSVLDHKPQEHMFPITLSKLVRPDDSVVTGNMISCRLNKNDLIKLGVHKVLNLDDFMADDRTFHLGFWYIDSRMLEDEDVVHEMFEFEDQNKRYMINASTSYNDSAPENWVNDYERGYAVQYIFLTCLKVLIAGLVDALSTYETQLDALKSIKTPAIFAYFTYKELSYFLEILKSPGRVKAMADIVDVIQAEQIYDYESYNVDLGKDIYQVIMSYLKGPRSQLSKSLSYPSYKDQEADDKIYKTPKISQKIRDVKLKGEQELVGYILGMPLFVQPQDLLII